MTLSKRPGPDPDASIRHLPLEPCHGGRRELAARLSRPGAWRGTSWRRGNPLRVDAGPERLPPSPGEAHPRASPALPGRRGRPLGGPGPRPRRGYRRRRRPTEYRSARVTGPGFRQLGAAVGEEMDAVSAPAPPALVGQEHFVARRDIVRIAPLPVGRVLDVGCGPG